MGLLINGEWHDKWYDTKESGGHFVRSEAQFRNFIENREDARFRPEAGRYHLYVSPACPWCHRVMITLALKGLDEVIPQSWVDALMLDKGWVFDKATDPLFDYDCAHQLYTRADPNYSGRVTVPVLWDTHLNTIASNESSELLRMLNTEFADLGANMDLDLYPEEHRDEIDALNAWIYDEVNNGVYRCGFATTQTAYEAAFDTLFAALDRLEAHLEGKRFLVGERLTEADVRLWPTLVRFDPVYFGHFKCNGRQIQDYPNLWAYTRRLYAMDAFQSTTHFDHIKTHYYGSHETINPTGVVPKGPVIDWTIEEETS